MIEPVQLSEQFGYEAPSEVKVQYGAGSNDVGIALHLPHDFVAGGLDDQDDQDFVESWVRMNRPEVNRLIRLLRKARDASFGRDE